MICPNCHKENIERNYYCYWCGNVLKERAAKAKKLKDRYTYLLDLPIVTDSSNDKGGYKSYRSKEKKKGDENI